ncbi:poly(hydroxyalkanoate) granule-associated protein [Oleiphilus sp. HI0071]|jgi:poly(hydroxyalkanoate) granule-associated protein|uniref:phasin family protein n=1 Tax=Oleiphilus sp. HI0080 TaxID=1822255 RepID=UPI0007C2D5EB|nr:phasin family protein [Oleiphilus sp. HI0080]KZY61051.1 poly(hydroxyalkanoate) granule-associated protein [Oleiphilus sp. HI0065]KZY83867.1 poly(hydroxyalkanoate) granule-associated protein [Oleiphilus sp. HI0071]KZY89735.1 poly(hydroxyalkanoate) granule-associated protein [Oleiphilus sp. HI0073]KZZ46431.1 poly(hydroxyalkanoate) granule-associated protein [Oleiphilus sp. HI0118]KZZ55828.1 poly(hydroxyalkanoate) granule-associated protein [Oleiphilus sp. HI0122]KZZ68018.1 poly(hydroxyalkano
MANKDNETPISDSANEQAHQLSDKIKESARQIWLAGLGAYNKAEEDTGKIFEKLVKEGEELESATRGAVEKRFKAVEGKVEGVRGKASNTFGKLESVFDERVSDALERLGIPNKKTLEALEARIEALEKELKKKK